MARIVMLATHPFLRWKNGADLCAMQLARQLGQRGHECELHLFLLADSGGWPAYRETLAAFASEDVPGSGGRPDRLVIGGLEVVLWKLRAPAEVSPSALGPALQAAVAHAVGDALRAGRPDAVIIPWGTPALGRMAADLHP